MGKIYVGQTALRFQLTTDVDVSGATCLIKYQKPDGSIEQWDAEIGDTDRGIIYYDVTSSDEIDLAGDWILWAHVTFAGGTSAPGEPNVIEVFEEGK